MADNKKEEFREYLEKKQVLEVLTLALVDLFFMEEKPENALKYFTEKFQQASEKLEKAAPAPAPAAEEKDGTKEEVAKQAQDGV